MSSNVRIGQRESHRFVFAYAGSRRDAGADFSVYLHDEGDLFER